MSTQNPSGTTPTTTPSDQMSSPSRKRAGTMSMGAAIGVAIVLLVIGIAGGYFLGSYLNKSSSSTSTVQITETGSSLLYPLMQSWGPNFTQYNSNIVLSPASTGSGTGQAYAEQGLIDIGGSDGYLANASQTSLVNVPVAISAQLVWYNLPGVTGHLNLNGTVLAMIYSGDITTWNNPLILAAQPTAVQTELNALSSQQIYVIKRGDSSGDTFLFTSYCDMSWSGWKFGVGNSNLSGDSIPHIVSATGNSGMVTAVEGQVGAIAYIGISYTNKVSGTGLSYAALGDNTSLSASGGVSAANYVLPTDTNISADANLGLARLNYGTYGLAVSLILGGSPYGAITLKTGGGGSTPAAGTTPYPIANLEYTLIKTSGNANAKSIVAFLEWAISYGNYAAGGAPSAYLTAVSFVPLTPTVVGYDIQELALVQ